VRQLFPWILFAVVLAAGGTGMAADSWQEPQYWGRVGTVQHWMDLDFSFYRTLGDSRFVDRSQFRLDQQEHYTKTRLYGGELPALSIAEFMVLPPSKQDQRRRLAADRLKYVERFLARVQEQVRRVQANLPSGWGDQVTDVTVMGDCLTRLGDAVGLDPSNPYAWHLQSYLTMCAGDEKRSRQYLDGAVEALKYVPLDALTDMKGRVALDLAWNQRQLGRFDDALASLELSEKMSGLTLEVLTLRGLIYAQTDRPVEAAEIASRLRSTDVRQFPTSTWSTEFKPELANPDSWKKIPSDYLAGWINCLALLREGNRELAASTLGSYSPNDVYRLGWRFWNEAGLIYETVGRSNEAMEAWNTARLNRPWLPYMVYRPYELALGVLTGHSAKSPYMLGYDRFYLAGSRLAHAASLVGKVGNAESPLEKQEWALRALDELEVCQKTGIYPGQASVLKGHLYYLLGDIPSTLNELEKAVALLEKQGDLEVQKSVMKDLAAISRNQQSSNMQSYLKQSGSSKGRWEAETDPEAREKELRARLKASPDDDQAVLDLSRFLIRHGRPAEGKALLASGEQQRGSVQWVIIQLEADRLLGETELAMTLVQKLDAGAADPWNDAGLWSLVGSICLEQGKAGEARRALQHALELDPENQGLRMQLRLMEGS
jgi:tetratricopeptide (TPR) repeat protein